jgi:hypothetical protein
MMDNSEIAAKLYWDGICSGWVWSDPDDVKEFRVALKGVPHYPGHVRGQGDGIPRKYEEAQGIETTSHDMADVVRAPYFLDFALSWTDLAEAYLGEFPRLYSVNAFWTRPGRSVPDPNIQEWHRDRDDRKFLVLFMYGSDVLADDDGPHCLAKGTHRMNDGRHRAPAGEPVERVYGPAGSFFFADTSALHRGIKPQRGERLLAWARWGVSDPPASYGWDKLSPVRLERAAPSERIRESTKLVVEWAS